MTRPSQSNPFLHIKAVRNLLKVEYEYEKAEFREQTESMGVLRQVKRGMCWYPVTVGNSYYNSLNQLVVVITRSSDIDIRHNFEFGKPVVFFYQSYDGKVTYFHFTATVNYADETRMVVVMPSVSAVTLLSSYEMLGVQVFFDETSYKAMFDALDVLESASTNSRLGQLRDIFIGSRQPDTRSIAKVSLPWLNASQQSAVNSVLAARDVAIVHGPPGTGKTTTLVEAIFETLHREPQVMVCAQSNTAVDWICEKLVDRGINVLRIGNPSRVNDKMLSFTYERRFADHPSYPELWAIRKEIRRLRSGGRRASYSDRESLRNRMSRLRDRAATLEIQINSDIFNSAHVVASTLMSSSHRLLMGHKFGTLFIDEAAQALEAACWIAIRKADRVVLAGDHKQLPPTIKSPEATNGGLDRTLMQILATKFHSAVTLLTIQYRMHRQIMEFSSRIFYGGKLTAAPEVSSRSILDLDTPISWIDTSEMGFTEKFVGENFGRINKPEADLLIDNLAEYIAKIGEHRILDERIDFGIISPYKAQVQYLSSRIKSSSRLKRVRHLFTVNTVDGFQGQERDVIFISLVRANDKGQIGFLNDLRRMNVAMTRARMKLVIIGDASTLATHKFYSSLLQYIENLDTEL